MDIKTIETIIIALLVPLIFTTIAIPLLSMSTTSSQLPSGPYPGDNVIPDAVMVYDQTRVVNAQPSDIWPWIMQVGKGRGGPSDLWDSDLLHLY